MKKIMIVITVLMLTGCTQYDASNFGYAMQNWSQQMQQQDRYQQQNSYQFQNQMHQQNMENYQWQQNQMLQQQNDMMQYQMIEDSYR